MVRNAAAVVLLVSVLSAWSAETVSNLSAPFSFPVATAAARPVQSLASTTLACQVLQAGGVAVRWSLGDPSAEGSIRVTGLDGRLVTARTVKGTAGTITLPHLPSGVYLITMSAPGAVRTVRAAVSR